VIVYYIYINKLYKCVDIVCKSYLSLNDIRSHRREFYYYFCDDLVEIKIFVIFIMCRLFYGLLLFVDELILEETWGYNSFGFILRTCNKSGAFLLFRDL